MSINDLLEQGVLIQGRVWIGGYANNGCAEFEFFTGHDGIDTSKNDGTDWLNRPIKFIYQQWQELRIEIECEDLYEEGA